ncbi:MAG: hypothetical protein O2960_20855 [Verrucomicrobia bacterium]|nr:hypothetical protein [Verrucomicrobiota bacterium]
MYVGVGEHRFGPVGEDVLISSDSTNWTSHSSGFSGFPKKLNDVIFADGRFLAVGSAGLIATSPDGAAWSKVLSGVSDELYGISSSGGRYVIVGGNHWDPFYPITSVALTSTNSVSWSRRDSATPDALVAISSGNGMFAAVGNEGRGFIGQDTGAARVIISLDGMKWRISGDPIHLRSVTFGGDTIVAVGDNGRIAVSSDMLNWTAGRNPSSAHLKEVAYGNGTFVAVGARGTILTSTNASDWEERMSGTNLDLLDVKFAGGLFVAGGGFREGLFDGTFGASTMDVISSRDGIEWTRQGFTGMGSLSAIAFWGGIFLGVGSMHFHRFVGWTVYALQSSDGLSWSQVPVPIPPSNYSRIEYGNGRFMALSPHGTATTLAEVNQIRNSWKYWNPEQAVLSGLGFGRSTFLALSPGAIFASIDGDSWQRLETGQAAALYDLAYGQNSFVAVGENGTIFQSSVFEDSIVTIANPTWINGMFHVSATTRVGQEYTLEFKDALEEQAWKASTPVAGSGTTMIFSDSNTTGRQRFYRVRVR